MTEMMNGASNGAIHEPTLAPAVETPPPALVETPAVPAQAAPTAKVAEYVARSAQPVDPDAIGPVPHQMLRAGQLVDITAPPGFEVVRVAFSRHLLELEPGQTPRQALAAQPYEPKAGEFIIVGVKNARSQTMIVSATLHVVNEHGEAAKPSVFRVLTPEAAAAGQKKGAGTMRGAADGPREPRPTEPMPRSVAPANAQDRRMPPPLPSGRRKKSQPKRRTVMSAPVPATPNADTALVAAPAAALAPAPAPAPVAAVEGEVVVVMFIGHADTLRTALDYGVPLVGPPRAAAILAFRNALERAPGEIAGGTANEVVIPMQRAAAAALDDALRFKRERFLDDKDVVLDPLRAALGLPTRRVPIAAAPVATLAAPAAAAETAPEQDVSAAPLEQAPQPIENENTGSSDMLEPLTANMAPDDGRAE